MAQALFPLPVWLPAEFIRLCNMFGYVMVHVFLTAFLITALVLCLLFIHYSNQGKVGQQNAAMTRQFMKHTGVGAVATVLVLVLGLWPWILPSLALGIVALLIYMLSWVLTKKTKQKVA